MFKRNMFLYQADLPAGSGGDPKPPTTPAPTPTPSGGTAGKTFTQEEVDRIVGERAQRAGESAVNKFLETLGVKSADDLKTVITDAQKLKDAQKSELERATEARTKAEADAKAAREQANTRVINAELRAVAAELGFSKPEKAIKLVDLATVKVDDAGNVTGVKEALEALAKDMPELLKAKGAPRTDAPNPAKPDGTQQETAAQRFARLRGGGVSDWLGKGNLVEYNKPEQ